VFEELGDVSLFQWDETDDNGLDLWLRFRGSNRADVHEKMSVTFGPWDLGRCFSDGTLCVTSRSCSIDAASMPLFDGATITTLVTRGSIKLIESQLGF
jgi:hypothetical protein